MHPDKKFARRRTLFGLMVVAGALLAAAVYFWQPESEAAPAKKETGPSASSARFGPGAWISPGASAAEHGDGAGYGMPPPAGLAATADQRLQVNRALHDVIDFFLLGGRSGDRAAHTAVLREYLRSSLPAPAYDDALQVVQHYLAYMDAHDELLARLSIPTPAPGTIFSASDLERVADWLMRRSRLRQTMLGAEAAQAWYEDEETFLLSHLAEMRESGNAAVDADSNQSSQDAHAVRERFTQELGERAVKRFDTQEREAQAWMLRYADYRRAVDRIAPAAGSAPTARALQVDALLAQTFLTEPERARARALDAQSRQQP